MEFLIPSLMLILFSLAQSSEAWFSSYKTCTWAFRHNPDDCGTFFQCSNGEAVRQSCPTGLHWNTKITACDWPKKAKCASKSTQANFVEQEKTACSGNPPYKRDPNQDCSKYFWCVQGEWVEQQCPSDLHWNMEISGCDWKSNVKCNTAGPVGPPAPPASGEVGPPAPPDNSTPEEPVWPPAPPPPTTTQKPVEPPAPPPPTETEEPAGPPAPPPPTDIEQPSNPGDYKVICYFTGWSTYRQGAGKFTPSNVDESLCTHIVYSFAVLDSNNWKIRIADSWMDIDNKYYKQITGLKRVGKKVTIAIGGWNDSEGSRWSNLLREPSHLVTFTQSVAEFIKKYNFDGIDLDYEYPSCPWGACDPQFQTDKSGFTALVIGLRNALPRPYIISAAVSCNKKIIDAGYDVSTISKYLDWIGVMDYDIHGSWDKRTGHIAPMYAHPEDTHDYLNVNTSIHHWMKRGADPSKLIMGIPLYGNSFTLSEPGKSDLFAPTSGPGERGQFTNQGGILAYYEICSQRWDRKVQDENWRMGPFMVKGNQWISYDDKATIIRKTQYIKANGLGGAMIWALDFDDFSNLCGNGKYPLLKTVQGSLLGNDSFSRSQRKRSAKISFRY